MFGIAERDNPAVESYMTSWKMFGTKLSLAYSIAENIFVPPCIPVKLKLGCEERIGFCSGQ